jgi:hypothetical protein
MKTMRRLFAMLCGVLLLLTLFGCAANPLREYNAALNRTIEETCYRQVLKMNATAIVDGTTIRVGIENNLICSGNTAATYAAVGTGAATVSAAGDAVTPYRLYVRDGIYYYNYENYFADGSDYRYKLNSGFRDEEIISDLFPILVTDVESAKVQDENGKTVIAITIKDEKAVSVLNDTLSPMDRMLFGETAMSVVLKDLTIVTTLDGEGRVEQCTATVLGSTSYYGSYVSILYVYDLVYSEYGTAPTPTFPDDLASYPSAE